MKILFDNRIGPPITWKDVEEEGIGASERALHEVSKYCAARGHTVYVIQNSNYTQRQTPNLLWCNKYTTYDSINPDVIIHFRRPNYKARPQDKVILWSTDDHDVPFLKNLSTYLKEQTPNKIIYLSKYHQESWNKNLGVTTPYKIIGLAADGKSNDLTQKQKIIVFMSAPYKGLHVLAKHWPKIKAGIINKEQWKLVIGGTMRLHRQTEADFAMKKIYDDLRLYGAEIKLFNRAETQELLRKASVMLYPNTYAETYGAAIYDAYAHRLVIVTNDKGSLDEILPTKLIQKEDPRSPEGEDIFIRKAILAINTIELADIRFNIREENDPVRLWSDVGREMLAAITEVYHEQTN